MIHAGRLVSKAKRKTNSTKYKPTIQRVDVYIYHEHTHWDIRNHLFINQNLRPLGLRGGTVLVSTSLRRDFIQAALNELESFVNDNHGGANG